MEGIIGFVQSALGLKARQGWFFFLVGAAMLLIVYFGILPSEEIAIGWKAFFTLLVVVGVVILLVSAGAQTYAFISAARADQRARDAEAAKRASDEADALQTARILTGLDAIMLSSILAANEQRFTPTREIYSLVAKKVVRPVEPRSGVYEVSAAVWEQREALLPELRNRSKRGIGGA